MRRLARRLVTLCSAVSLLLCVTVGALWIRSYWHHDQWSRVDDEREESLSISTSRGRVLWWWDRPATPLPMPADGAGAADCPEWAHFVYPRPRRLITCAHQRGWPLPGLYVGRGGDVKRDQVIIAHLHLALVCAALPGI